MFSRTFSRAFSSIRPPASAATRYAPRYTPTQLRSATSTTPGAGNPDIVNKLPSTANEIEQVESTEVQKTQSTAEPSSVSEQARIYHGDGSRTDWSRSYHGLSVEPFPKEAAEILQAPLDPENIEVKPGELRTGIPKKYDSFKERRSNIPT